MDFWWGVRLCGIVTAHALYIINIMSPSLCHPPLSQYNEYSELLQYSQFSEYFKSFNNSEFSKFSEYSKRS